MDASSSILEKIHFINIQAYLKHEAILLKVHLFGKTSISNPKKQLFHWNTLFLSSTIRVRIYVIIAYSVPDYSFNKLKWKRIYSSKSWFCAWKMQNNCFSATTTMSRRKLSIEKIWLNPVVIMPVPWEINNMMLSESPWCKAITGRNCFLHNMISYTALSNSHVLQIINIFVLWKQTKFYESKVKHIWKNLLF